MQPLSHNPCRRKIVAVFEQLHLAGERVESLSNPTLAFPPLGIPLDLPSELSERA